MEKENFRMFPTSNRFNWRRNIWISEEVTRRTLSRTYSPKFHSQDCTPVTEREIFARRRNPFDAKLRADTFSSNSFFDVLLTAHLSIILLINQLNAQILVL